MRNTVRGRFKPKNPEKYKGDPGNIFYRSSWEYQAMQYFDRHRDILEWSSEEVAIPYRDPTKASKDHQAPIRRYFPDFVVKLQNKEGVIETLMIEVKPYAQTVPPKGRRILKEQATEYVRNMAKWDQAKKYCARKGWRFFVMTEKELGIING